MNKQMKRKIKFTGSEENFVNLLEKHFLENDYLTKREVNIGNGVADLVLAKVNDLNIKKRSIKECYRQF